MEQSLANNDLSTNDANEEIFMENKKKGKKQNKCNQCDYANSRPSHLRIHLKIHSGEKSNKCNQCGYTSSQASNLKTHSKTHSALCSLREQLEILEIYKNIS